MWYALQHNGLTEVRDEEEKVLDVIIQGFLFEKMSPLINPFTSVGYRALLDFTLSNARRFYSSMREPLKSEKVNDVKKLNVPI